MASRPVYRKVTIKLSGEAFSGGKGLGIDRSTVEAIASAIARIASDGVQTSVVVGAGNIFRGSAAADEGMDRAAADYAGMVATVVNALALQDTLEHMGLETRAQSAIEMRSVAEPFIRRRAIRHLEKGRVVIFAAGTGNPFFTTDTAAVLRAVEVGAQVLVKATNVDGVYDDDPRTSPDARLLREVDYMDALNRGLKVMDSTAISLAMDNDLPIIVVNIRDPMNICRAVSGEVIGTLVRRTHDD